MKKYYIIKTKRNGKTIKKLYGTKEESLESFDFLSSYRKTGKNFTHLTLVEADCDNVTVLKEIDIIYIPINPYTRYSTHSIEEVETLFKKEIYMGKRSKERTEIGGKSICTYDPRYRVFFEKGYKCVSCGIEGKYFALEWCVTYGTHLNLYALDDKGREVMMTRDHIIPKSVSHDNSIDNMQTMCSKCNNEKGDKMPDDFI